MKNEPNLACPDLVEGSRPAVRPLSTYSGQHPAIKFVIRRRRIPQLKTQNPKLKTSLGSSSSLRPKQHTVSNPQTKICETNPILQKPPIKPQKTGKALLFTPLFTKKVQLFTTFHRVNPRLNNSFFVSTCYLLLATYYCFLQLFTTALRSFMRRWDFSTKRKLLFTTFRPKNMRNEPNLKNTQINITAVPTKAYMKNDCLTPTQNEPKTNPISNFPLRLEHFNIFYSHLGRREDKAGKEDCTAILKYCEQI